MADEMMIGFKRPVLVRTKHNFFGATIAGQWHDKRSGLAGPVVKTTGGTMINIDWKRIVRYTDTDEIPWQGGDYEELQAG